MQGVLFGVSRSDPATYASVVAVIAISGLMASLVPAIRALSIDPVAVLKRD